MRVAKCPRNGEKLLKNFQKRKGQQRRRLNVVFTEFVLKLAVVFLPELSHFDSEQFIQTDKKNKIIKALKI